MSEHISTTVSVTGEITLAETELLRVPCEVYGVGITFILKASATMEGEIAFTWSVDATQSFEYDTGLFSKPKYYADADNAKMDDVEFKLSFNFKASFSANLTVMQCPLVNIGVSSGVTASASTKASKPECVDLALYVPMTVFIGADDKETLLGLADIKWKGTMYCEDGIQPELLAIVGVLMDVTHNPPNDGCNTHRTLNTWQKALKETYPAAFMARYQK